MSLTQLASPDITLPNLTKLGLRGVGESALVRGGRIRGDKKDGGKWRVLGNSILWRTLVPAQLNCRAASTRKDPQMVISINKDRALEVKQKYRVTAESALT
ncbi:hypothetical protein Tco_1132128 [Tanacetum coccineum]|uniref:Uncharacterized protein n=1 Tax=Tanacetum coccineum TaxID=301880 RepID=A0ABQ5JB19_9ASTR